MPGRRDYVHCELGLVPAEDTAASRICKLLPVQLTERGFRVTCSALLARVAVEDAAPATPWDKQLFQMSRCWFAWALRRPRRFDWTRSFTGVLPRWRRHRGVIVYLDPFCTLFYGVPDSGIVLVHDLTPVTMEGWHDPYEHWLYGEAFAGLARSRCHLVASCRNTADQLRVNWGIAPGRVSALAPEGFNAHFFDGLATIIRRQAG